MRKHYILLFFLLINSLVVLAQRDNIVYDDSIYQENIHSIQFHINGLVLTQPIVDMTTRATLRLGFDDLGEDVRSYYYTIIHCNSDWTPSELTTLEYIDGFDEEEIRDPQFSFNTLTEYTHYELRIPNRYMRWTKSGNYILLVYDEDKAPVFSRRFLVVEPLVKIAHQMTRPAAMDKFRTHQEFDFSVSFEGLQVKEPKRELKATILQNGRWDTAIKDVPPYFLYDGEVVYDYQDKITFPAGREYRFVDLRTLQYEAEGVLSIEEFKDIYEVTLYTDPVRNNESYSFLRDANGHFTIENLHRSNDTLESDYAMVLFSLKKSVQFKDAEVYLYGKMTDWKIQDTYKMTYNKETGYYLVDVLLKQGYYNYAFALVSNKDKNVTFSETEGNWHETENDYTVLIYYRSFGDRYDRLVGTYTFNSFTGN